MALIDRILAIYSQYASSVYDEPSEALRNHGAEILADMISEQYDRDMLVSIAFNGMGPMTNEEAIRQVIERDGEIFLQDDGQYKNEETDHVLTEDEIVDLFPELVQRWMGSFDDDEEEEDEED